METLFCLATCKNSNLKNFVSSFYLDSLIDSPTCYKSMNPTSINLILTNKKNDFIMNELITTVLRKIIGKDISKRFFYRDFKTFDQKKFQSELKVILY